VAGALALLYLARLISATPDATAITLIGLAGLSGVAAAAAHRTDAVLVSRLDLLRRALDAAPDAHLIVAPGERLCHANTAFDRLFPETAGSPLDRIERAVALDGEAVARLRHLRRRAAIGGRAAAATICLRTATGGDGSRFRISARPVAGSRGYCFWS